jgi:hypothetical protein
VLEAREALILEALRSMPEDVVLIGEYAVNAFVPPRFSIDCDLVVFDKIPEITKIMKNKGFTETERGDESNGEYIRFVRKGNKISFDLMLNSVLDRETGVVFEGDLFKRYSRVRATTGRVNPTLISMRIADPELLFAMKFVSARRQDVRDVFMLSGVDVNWNLIKEIIEKKGTKELIRKRANSIKTRVNGVGYRDSLQGAFGRIPDKAYEKCIKNLDNFLDAVT